MRHLLPILALLLVLPALGDTGKPAPHTCRVLFFNPPAGAPGTLQLFDGATCREVELPKMNFSPVYELPPGRLALCLLPAPPQDPARLPAGAPRAVVPEDVVDFYLFVTSDPKNQVAPVRMQVINAGSDRLKAGQMLWFNLTANTVAGTLGSERLLILPGKRVVLDPPARGNVDYPVSLGFRIPNDPNTYPLCETRWRHDPRSRSVIFIQSEEGSRTPRVRGFSDYREPKPKTPGDEQP